MAVSADFLKIQTGLFNKRCWEIYDICGYIRYMLIYWSKINRTGFEFLRDSWCFIFYVQVLAIAGGWAEVLVLCSRLEEFKTRGLWRFKIEGLEDRAVFFSWISPAAYGSFNKRCCEMLDIWDICWFIIVRRINRVGRYIQRQYIFICSYR